MEQKSKSVSPFSSESRNKYVIEHITDAMLTLLKDKEIHEISISELCDLAGVGRTSFYRNFDSKEDIIKKYIYNLLDEWKISIPSEDKQSMKDAFYHLFKHLEQNKDFYKLLYKRHLHEYIKDYILDIMNFNPDQELPQAYASAYIAFFIYGWIEVWFRRGMKDTAEELAKYLPEK